MNWQHDGSVGQRKVVSEHLYARGVVPARAVVVQLSRTMMRLAPAAGRHSYGGEVMVADDGQRFSL